MKVFKSLINKLLRPFDLAVHRRPDPVLPNLHTVMLDGKLRKLWISNSATKSWWMKPEISMNGELRQLRRLTGSGETVLEIGAHHGLMTLLLSDWVGPSGIVYAIEASSENAMVLDANCFQNQLTNVATALAAVSFEGGTARFGGESLSAASGVVRDVPMISVDEFCRKNQVARIDLLKIDVEGFECGVLQGAAEILKQHPKLALELHIDLLSQSGSSAHKVWQLLEDAGMLEDRKITMVCRPDWDDVKMISRFAEIPDHGVVNLFLS